VCGTCRAAAQVVRRCDAHEPATPVVWSRGARSATGFDMPLCRGLDADGR